MKGLCNEERNSVCLCVCTYVCVCVYIFVYIYMLQRGCHLRAGGSDVFECCSRLLDFNSVPDVSWEKTMARELKKKRKEIHKMKRRQEEEGEEDDYK